MLLNILHSGVKVTNFRISGSIVAGERKDNGVILANVELVGAALGQGMFKNAHRLAAHDNLVLFVLDFRDGKNVREQQLQAFNLLAILVAVLLLEPTPTVRWPVAPQ